MLNGILGLDPRNVPNVILLGTEGLGQKEDALRIAAHILGTELEFIASCTDYLYIDGHGGSIKKSDTDKLMFFAAHAPVESAKRVILVDAADALTKQAQNALLKTLEDGVEVACFLFVTRSELLPTIHSRSVTITYELESDDAIRKRLLKAGASVNEDILMAANGSEKRYYELMADEDFVKDISSLKSALAKGTVRAVLSAVGCLSESDMRGDKAKCLFMKYSFLQCNALYDYLGKILCNRYMELCGTKSENNAGGMLSYMGRSQVEKLIGLVRDQSELFRQHRPVTKSDFFVLMCHFTKEE